jgi:pimeloyl-ACP methyl ester carboxylesterase
MNKLLSIVAILLFSSFSVSHYIIVDGVRLHYREWGRAEPGQKDSFLLLHGFGASTFSWERVADSLHSMGYHVVAVDIPPFGYSDKNPNLNHSLTARAIMFHQFLNHEYPGHKWHIAGHSMGGGIAQAMVASLPEAFNSLFLVSATVFVHNAQWERQMPLILRLPVIPNMIANIAESYFITPSRVESLLESAYGQPPEPWQVEQYLKPLKFPGTARAILNIPRNYIELFELQAQPLQVPVYAIWGRHDSWVRLQHHKEVLEILQAELHVIENAAHVPHETHFEEFMQALFQVKSEK